MPDLILCDPRGKDRFVVVRQLHGGTAEQTPRSGSFHPETMGGARQFPTSHLRFDPMLEMEGARPAAIHAPIAISADHRLVFAWVKGEGLIFEMVSGRVLQRLPACPVLRHAVFHPRRPVVSLLGVDDLLIWEFETSVPPSKVDRHGYTSPYLHHAWRDDGRALAAGCEDGTVMVWDVSTLKSKQVRYHGLSGHEQPCVNVAFNHAGDKLVSCSRGADTLVWFPFNWGGESIAKMSRGYGVQFSQDDRHLVCLRPGEAHPLRLTRPLLGSSVGIRWPA